MAEIKKQGVYFVPIGGADNIGMNMFAYSSNGKWIVVDAGYGFLNDEYPGMDMCYASPDFLADFKDDIEEFIAYGYIETITTNTRYIQVLISSFVNDKWDIKKLEELKNKIIIKPSIPNFECREEYA